MAKQSEQQLENELVAQLQGLGYGLILINSEEDLLGNLKAQLSHFNGIELSGQEFKQVLNHLAKGNIFDKAKTLRERYVLTRDNGDVMHIRFFNSEEPQQNRYQVCHQISQTGSYKNRYDVTLLVNGLPLVQIELKRRGLEIKEAFNQINRYKRHSFWTNYGLFQYVQLYVISNGVNTKYYVNNPLVTLNITQLFYWADVNNKTIQELGAFAGEFLHPHHLGNMLSKYVVLNETFKMLMVLRPYQYYAVEALVERVRQNAGNGYIWHTTGSGKTLTSFKASQIIMNLPEVDKVVFVVDRKDLDYQTMLEFNSFKKDSVTGTDNTKNLVAQLKDDTKLVVTTIQKLNNAIRKSNFKQKITHLQGRRMVFIFDECHRTQFGDTHKRIKAFFNNTQLFGFTGTPIFAKNASTNEHGKRTTADLFEKCLHKYVISDAIRDRNVLQFSIEYLGRYKKSGKTNIDIEVEDIDKREAMDSPKRLETIARFIYNAHALKTYQKKYSSIFAVSSIDNLIKYYELFKQIESEEKQDIRVATIFSYAANEDDAEARGLLPEVDEPELPMAAENAPVYKTSHTREKLEAFVQDYNNRYHTSFSTTESKEFENYFKHISKKLKEREKASFDDKDRIDILLVVNMFLTGFDAKMVNTLYVDKNVKYHGLIQAYSRTNRIINEQKSQGNILAFRNLKGRTDEALALFSDKQAIENVIIPEYEKLLDLFEAAFFKVLSVASRPAKVDELKDEEAQLEFIKAFRNLIRNYNVLKTHVEFSWDDTSYKEQVFEDFKSKYLDLRDEVQRNTSKEKDSILEDVDFEVELIHKDEINVAYILRLLAKFKGSEQKEKEKLKKQIIDMLTGEVELRSKRKLIEKFIEEHLPLISDSDRIEDEFEKYWKDQQVLALREICDAENLDQVQFSKLIEKYVYTEREPLRDEVFGCLENRPSILKAREIGERIIIKMKEYVQTFMLGMTG